MTFSRTKLMTHAFGVLAVRTRPSFTAGVRRVSVLAVLVAGVCFGRPAEAASAGSGGCSLTFASPLVTALAGTFGGVVIDDRCRYVFLTNTDQNRVEVFSLATLTFEAPIQVGSMPVGLDITPDGSLLYVANSGGNNISVVSLAQRTELRKIPVIPGFSNDRPYSIAIADNGIALFTTTFSGSGFGGRMMQLVLATDSVSGREDFGAFTGVTTESTRLRASRDRSSIGIVVGNNSAGPVSLYSAASNTFSGPQNQSSFISDVALDMTGSTLLVTPAGHVLDSSLLLSGTVPLEAGQGGGAIDPTWGIGYRAIASRLDVLNLNTFLKTGELPLGDTVSSAQLFNFVGRMDISSDGTLLAVITDNGLSLVRPFPTAPVDVNLVRNGDFTNGLTRWLTFSAPSAADIDVDINGSVLEFSRGVAAPGSTNQAVVFQETGMALAAGAPLEAQFDLGNSSSVRKRISVLVADASFTDLHVCTFWLPPGQALTTFGIRTHTTSAWSNATIFFYAATQGSDGGAYRIDNVALEFDPTLPDDATTCIDPLAPPAGAPATEPSLLQNGDFESAGIAPWATFGTITSEVIGGVFSFVRPTSAQPAGVVLQATGESMTAGQILTATFELGNSSAVRKRVTAILHDNDFSDLSACTFWLEPGQPLSAYTYRTYTTEAWTNATLSIYPATTGTHEWIQLDNVTLQRTPGATIVGTECLEPAGSGDPRAGGWSATTSPVPQGRVALASPDAVAPLPGGGRSAVGSPSNARLFDHWIVDGFLPVGDWAEGPSWTATADGPRTRTLQMLEPLDLAGVQSAVLRFDSTLRARASTAAVQVSVEGGLWQTVHMAGVSDAASPVTIDLDAHSGRVIRIRFVFDTTAPLDEGPDVWHLSDLRLDVFY
jgi:DNA-binding beta-propeller fold protein YncE